MSNTNVNVQMLKNESKHILKENMRTNDVYSDNSLYSVFLKADTNEDEIIDKNELNNFYKIPYQKKDGTSGFLYPDTILADMDNNENKLLFKQVDIDANGILSTEEISLYNKQQEKEDLQTTQENNELNQIIEAEKAIEDLEEQSIKGSLYSKILGGVSAFFFGSAIFGTVKKAHPLLQCFDILMGILYLGFSADSYVAGKKAQAKLNRTIV